ncbi:hypothetical protein [Bacillus cereus group sp. BfR-BA-01383]|uniref:hypothetical protein n=1 Tax=Bacillus cereus group sp. BfR-BA-01383 TaxID=2920327 RepID=UPI001F578CB0|nr:hypothetical protein [Bacillus cereus group sp. BfR-BA-01383]
MALGWEHAITVVGAFASAGTAQYFSHKLTLKREDEKYQKERYQNFYAPLVYKINNYVKAEANKFEELLIDEGTILKLEDGITSDGSTFSTIPDSDSIFIEIISIIENNLKYADIQFIEMYERHKMHEFQNKNIVGDGLTNIKWQIRLPDNLLVCEKFLIEYLSFHGNVSVLSKKTETEIRKTLTSITLYNLMKKNKFHRTANLFFIYTCKYSDAFIRFPNLDQEVDRVKRKVTSKVNKMIKVKGQADISCYRELTALILSIQDHINNSTHNSPIFRYSTALENAINKDISNT